MRKLILSIVAIAATLTASAQYKPEAGSITTGVNLQLFNDAENISTQAINARYFINDGLAARLTLGFGMDASSSNVEDIAAKTVTKAKSNQSFFGLALGIEKHFDVAPRLSPYIGAELGFISFGYTASSDILNNATTPAFTEVKKYNGIDKDGRVHARNGFNVSIFTGVDFYMYKGLYAGVEYGIGYNTTWNGSWQTETKNNDGTTIIKSDDNGKKKGSNSSLAIQATPSFKLGWKF